MTPTLSHPARAPLGVAAKLALFGVALVAALAAGAALGAVVPALRGDDGTGVSEPATTVTGHDAAGHDATGHTTTAGGGR